MLYVFPHSVSDVFEKCHIMCVCISAFPCISISVSALPSYSINVDHQSSSQIFFIINFDWL